MIASSILVCFAMKEEASVFRKNAADKTNASILLTGIGRKNSERTVGEVFKNGPPKAVLTCGFAGGLNPDLVGGDVLFSTDDAQLHGRLTAAGARPGTFHCAARIATTVGEKHELRRATSADAVEM